MPWERLCASESGRILAIDLVRIALLDAETDGKEAGADSSTKVDEPPAASGAGQDEQSAAANSGTRMIHAAIAAASSKDQDAFLDSRVSLSAASSPHDWDDVSASIAPDATDIGKEDADTSADDGMAAADASMPPTAAAGED